jgi:hypothetical protein
MIAAASLRPSSSIAAARRMARDGITAAIQEAIQCALIPGSLIAGPVNPGRVASSHR